MVHPRKGRRSIHCVSILLLTAFASQAQTLLPSPEAREQMIGLLEREALHRDRVDWAKLRSDLSNAQTPAQQRALLQAAMQEATAGHGKWIAPEQLTDKQAGVPVAATMQVAETSVGTARVERDARLGWVEVGRYKAGMALAKAERRAEDRKFAGELLAAIRQQDDGSRCGWIVDLRSNSGGNMWPMLLGIGPLLHGTSNETAPVGYFDYGGSLQPWHYRAGMVGAGNAVWLEVRDVAYQLKQPTAPVAILQSARTASSGEALVLAFRGRPNARSFGFPTAGYSTGNRPVTLVDGSMLVLTGSVMKDRAGMGDGARILPDTPASSDVEVLQAAQQWLLAQPACTGKAESSTS